MYTLQNYLSYNQQDILILLLDDKLIFNKQNYFKSRRAFKKKMNCLVNAGWVQKRLLKIDGHFENEYELTIEGIFVAKVIEGFANGRNRKKI